MLFKLNVSEICIHFLMLRLHYEVYLWGPRFEPASFYLLFSVVQCHHQDEIRDTPVLAPLIEFRHKTGWVCGQVLPFGVSHLPPQCNKLTKSCTGTSSYYLKAKQS